MPNALVECGSNSGCCPHLIICEGLLYQEFYWSSLGGGRIGEAMPTLRSFSLLIRLAVTMRSVAGIALLIAVGVGCGHPYRVTNTWTRSSDPGATQPTSDSMADVTRCEVDSRGVLNVHAEKVTSASRDVIVETWGNQLFTPYRFDTALNKTILLPIGIGLFGVIIWEPCLLGDDNQIPDHDGNGSYDWPEYFVDLFGWFNPFSAIPCSQPYSTRDVRLASTRSSAGGAERSPLAGARLAGSLVRYDGRRAAEFSAITDAAGNATVDLGPLLIDATGPRLTVRVEVEGYNNADSKRGYALNEEEIASVLRVRAGTPSDAEAAAVTTIPEDDAPPPPSEKPASTGEIEAAVEESAFARVDQERSVAACDAYLSRFPTGAKAAEVHDICDELTWHNARASGRADEIRAWIVDHPESPFQSDANGLLEDLLFRQAETTADIAACQAYLDQFPDGNRASSVRQLKALAAAWQDANERDTVAAYEAFARKFPGSRFASAAAQKADFEYWQDRAADPNASGHVLIEYAALCERKKWCSSEELRGLYQRAVEAGSSDDRAVLALGKIAFHDGDYATADALISRAMARNEQSGEVQLYKGRLVATSGDCRAAIAHFDRAIELSPSLGDAFFQRAFCHWKLDGCAQAIPDFERAARLSARTNPSLAEEATKHAERCR